MENTLESKKIKPIREGIFENADGQYFLVGTRCKSCHQHFYPPVEICPVCFVKDVERVQLSRRGKLQTWTLVWVPPAGFEAPYGLAYVDLPEKVRVFAHLEDYKPETLKPGMEMELVIGKIRVDREGNNLIGPKFRPAAVGD